MKKKQRHQHDDDSYVCPRCGYLIYLKAYCLHCGVVYYNGGPITVREWRRRQPRGNRR